MTRYQAAMSKLSTLLARARTPSGSDITREVGEREPLSLALSPQAMDPATRSTRTLTLPPSWQRHDSSLAQAPLRVRLWRAIGGGGRRSVD
jgi:hypothetical protein